MSRNTKVTAAVKRELISNVLRAKTKGYMEELSSSSCGEKNNMFYFTTNEKKKDCRMTFQTLSCSA